MNLSKQVIDLHESDDYESWLKEYERLDKATSDASDTLNNIDGVGGGGMTPDDVKSSKEFKSAKANYEKASKEAKAFIKKSPKQFMKKRSDDRRNKWRNK